MGQPKCTIAHFGSCCRRTDCTRYCGDGRYGCCTLARARFEREFRERGRICTWCNARYCKCLDILKKQKVTHLRVSQLPRSIKIDIARRYLQSIRNVITWMSSSPLAVGGCSTVFEAAHSEYGRVALKRLQTNCGDYHEDWIRRFKREADTSRSLQHQHILRAYSSETLEHNGHLYIILPFKSRGNLLHHIINHPKDNRIRLLCMTADGLHYLHENQIIHGDIKAINILMNEDGSLQLCDFGLAKPNQSRTSDAMRGLGTLRWQSPELWVEDDTSKTFSSDVYAFSMTIVEVLTGELPYKEIQNDGAVVVAVMKGRRPPKAPTESPTGISYENVWEVATACWHRDPAERLSSAEAHRRIAADPSLWK